MNNTYKFVTVICFIVFGLIIITFGILMYAILCAPLIPTHYTEDVKTDGEIEAKYLAMGPYETNDITEEISNPAIKNAYYFPEELKTSNKTYPVVVVVNSEGVMANKIKPILQHLASWGFVVVGNYDFKSIDGDSALSSISAITLANNNKNHQLYQKMDMNNIGVTGHSQGSIGIYHALTKQLSNDIPIYKCAVLLSPTGNSGEILSENYNFSKITCPFMILTGTLKEETSFDDVQKIFKNNTSTTKVLARKSDTKHGQMMYSGDGYVTAWFMYYLQNDKEAGQFFRGEHPEILNNTLYQDQQIDIMDVGC